MRRIISIGLLFACAIGFAQVPTTVTRNFGGNVVKLSVPAGYCPIEREDAVGSALYKMQDEINVGRNRVALLFVDCKEWADYLSGKIDHFKHHGSYLFGLRDGKEVLASYTRRQLLDGLLTLEKENKGLSSKEIQDQIQKAVKKKIEQVSGDEISMEGASNLGLMDVNEDAVFYGMGATVKFGNEKMRVNGISGVTVVNGAQTAINLYAEIEKVAAFSSLLVQQKRNINQFIVANK